MPPRPEQQGERLSSLEAKFDGFERYEHERWHALNNTLQPLVGLPLQLTRDIAKIQGTFDGRIAGITKEIERSITAAVEKAIEPVNADIVALKAAVKVLEGAKSKDEGARGVIASILNSRLLAWLLAVLGAAWAVLSGKHP